MNKNIFDYELKDGIGEKGGISFAGETLKDFLEETGMSMAAPMQEINKALVECGILPIFEFSWNMEKNKYERSTERLSEMVDQYVGCVNIGNITADIVIRNYEKNGEDNFSYSFDLYVYGENTGYGYRKDKNGNDIPYDYAEGTDIDISSISDLKFEDFKKKAEEQITEYIVLNDKKDSVKNPYSLVEKASRPMDIEWQ